MSHRLISRSSDLSRLRDAGYDIEVISGHLVLYGVPYVTSNREVARGVLISQLDLSGDITTRPRTHVVFFCGEAPCDARGHALSGIGLRPKRLTLREDLIANHRFSAKPSGGYGDYYEKMTTYVAYVSGPARDIDPDATAQTHGVRESLDQESPFRYEDSASSRAEIVDLNSTLRVDNIAIVGLGGTGAYILDFVSKTPVRTIHLIDGDDFLQHNAFRSPGAASAEELQLKLKKVQYYGDTYSRMRRGIVLHPTFLDPSNIGILDPMDFVFLAIDRPEVKRPIAERLEANGTPFIDVGMGVVRNGDALLGLLCVTTSTPECRKHVYDQERIAFTRPREEALYGTNIQIADLNALNAALAVIKWKKLSGFYVDQEREHFATYMLAGNHLLNEDKKERV